MIAGEFLVEEKPLKPILNNLIARFLEPEQKKKSTLINQWPEIVGGQFSKHTKPRFANDGNVTVWVDDSTLAFELRHRYKPLLLKRLQHQFGEDKVKDIKFFVGEIR